MQAMRGSASSTAPLAVAHADLGDAGALPSESEGASDGAGIPDSVEWTTDSDGDGILEYQNDDEFFSKGTPFKFEFTITNSGETSARIISYLVSQCSEIGIVCEPRVVDWSFYSDMLKRRDFDAMIMSWSASSPESVDPIQTRSADYAPNITRIFRPSDGPFAYKRFSYLYSLASRETIKKTFHLRKEK